MSALRDHSILLHIIRYCDQIEETMELFGRDYDTFLSSNTYRNACCMCLLQIGELTNAFTEEFRTTHTGVPWKQIRGFRNIVAHAYGTVEPEIVWEIITDDILKLKKYCRELVESEDEN